MSDSIEHGLNLPPDDFESMSNDEILDILRQSIRGTLEYTIKVARALVELKRRGVNTNEIMSVAISKFYFRIAEGMLLPSLYLRYVGRTWLLSAINTLPISDQKRLDSDPRVDVAIITDGKRDTRTVDIADLHEDHRSQVFQHGTIATLAQQWSYLDSRPLKRSRKAKVVVVDAHTDEPLTESVTVRLTAGEKVSLVKFAADSGPNVKVGQIVRNALARIGAI